MKEIIDFLKAKAQELGYITFDDILRIAENGGLYLKEIDSIAGILMDQGILILEKAPAEETGVDLNPTRYDKSQLNYDDIFNEIVRISPTLSVYVNAVRKIHAPRRGEEEKLVPLAKNGNKYALRRIILMFLKVVLRQALFFYKEYGLSLEETIQEGNIGLLTAIQKFEIRPGNRFSTYAPRWIQQKILRNATREISIFYITANEKQRLLNIIRHLDPKNLIYFPNKYKFKNKLPSISKAVRIEQSELLQHLEYLETPLSFEQDTNQVDHLMQINKAEDELFIETNKKITKKIISNILESCSPRDKVIIELRYGFDGSEPMSLEEVGVKLGVTRERVRQIEARILPILRNELRNQI